MGHCPEIFNSVFFMILTIWTLKVFPNLALICSKILFRNNDTAESDYLESLTLMSQKYFCLRSFYWSPRFSPSEILLYFSKVTASTSTLAYLQWSYGNWCFQQWYCRSQKHWSTFLKVFSSIKKRTFFQTCFYWSKLIWSHDFIG